MLPIYGLMFTSWQNLKGVFCVCKIWRLVDEFVGAACRIGVPQISEPSTVRRFLNSIKKRKTHTEHTQLISTFQAARIVAETTCRCKIWAIFQDVISTCFIFLSYAETISRKILRLFESSCQNKTHKRHSFISFHHTVVLKTVASFYHAISHHNGSKQTVAH